MAEPETYELDLPDDDDEGQSTPAPRPKPAPPPVDKKPDAPRSGVPAEDAGYELEEPTEEPSPSRTLPPSMLDDPRAGEPESASDTPTEDEPSVPPPPPPGAGDRPKVSEKVYKPQGDPEFVDPEVARMRREDQRRAAAQQAAIEAAEKKKRNLIIGGVLLAIVVLAFVVWKVFL